LKYSAIEIIRHLENYWETQSYVLTDGYGPKQKLHEDFKVVEFLPGGKHDFWIYSTAGMSIGRTDGRNIELHIFSNKQDRGLIRVLASAASFHKNIEPLGLNHTVYIGMPWQNNSKCDHAFISLPYLDGEALELFENPNGHLHNFWLIPITETERNFKVEHGWEKLEVLFEEQRLNYLDATKESLI